MKHQSYLVGLLCCGVLALFSAQAVHGGILYLADGSNLYSIDLVTAEKTFVGPAACDGLALSPNPSSFLYGTSSGTGSYEGRGFLHTVVPSSGSVHFKVLVEGDADRGLTYNFSNGMLYGTDNRSFGSISPETGEVSALSAPSTEPECLAVDPITSVVYGVDRDEGLIAYDISTDTWSYVGLTEVTDGGKGGLAYDPVTNLLYFSNTDGDLYSIDPASLETVSMGKIDGIESFVGLTYIPDLPVPDIKANGSDESISVTPSEPVAITVSCSAGPLSGSISVEVWILAEGPDGWYYFDLSGGTGWNYGIGLSYEGLLADLPTRQIWNNSLEAGNWEISFHIDLVINGVQDPAQSDSVAVIVAP